MNDIRQPGGRVPDPREERDPREPVQGPPIDDPNGPVPEDPIDEPEDNPTEDEPGRRDPEPHEPGWQV